MPSPQLMPQLPPKPRIAVVGANGLVGQMLLQVLAKRQFPSTSITHLSPRGSEPQQAADADLVFLVCPATVSRKYAPTLVAAGCQVVDLSSAWRLDPDIPLVIPEINAASVTQHRGIFASPNCTNVPLAMTLAALQAQTSLRQIVVTTLQAASGAGRTALQALRGHSSPFGQELVNNFIPQCGALDAVGNSAEEQRLEQETQRLLAAPQLPIHATCVRVPVEVGHGLAVYLRTAEAFSSDDARGCLSTATGIKIYENDDFPTVRQAAGNDWVHVGRIRRGASPYELQLWIVCDNLRKGAATNAVQIAELLLPLRCRENKSELA